MSPATRADDYSPEYGLSQADRVPEPGVVHPPCNRGGNVGHPPASLSKVRDEAGKMMLEMNRLAPHRRKREIEIGRGGAGVVGPPRRQAGGDSALERFDP